MKTIYANITSENYEAPLPADFGKCLELREAGSNTWLFKSKLLGGEEINEDCFYIHAANGKIYFTTSNPKSTGYFLHYIQRTT